MENHPNFYVDLSHFIFDKKEKREKFMQLVDAHPAIKEKLLFGTDWYLIGSEEARFGKYATYVKTMYDTLAAIHRELIAYFTVINPKRFLNLNALSEKLFALFGGDCDIRDFVKKLPDTIDQFKQNGVKK